SWTRHAGRDQGGRGVDLVAAGKRHLVGVDRWDPPLVEDAQGVQRARVMQAALEDDIEAGGFRPQVEDELAVVHPLDVHPAPGEGLEQQLLLGPDPGAENSNPHSPQSSSSSGARRSSAGSRSTTSSSAPHSAQGTISPFSTSAASLTLASHSGHFAVTAVAITTPPRSRPSRAFLSSRS